MKINYRPEIDGLRTLAVLSVIIYHAQFSLSDKILLKGGFLGVDIFFVISGYLITSLILKELKTTNNFSFFYFYQRRARRILPVLFTVMVASIPFAWLYLLPARLIDFSKSILYSIGFNSNFYFHYSGLRYGAEDGLLKPFLHTWSLSVEEQFYVIFPVILILIFKFFKKYLFHLFIIGFFTSLLLANWGAYSHPSFNFYILPTRGWEILAGSILAFIELKKNKRSKLTLGSRILNLIGVTLIFYSFISFNDKMYHPSFITLVPIIGVTLIIWFSNNKDIITKILSTKIFVGIGLISYSLYLWHYPVFAYARVSGLAENDILGKIFLIFFVFLLSIASYFIIEKPFRNKTKINFKNLLNFLIFLLVIIVSFNILSIKNGGFVRGLPEILYKDHKIYSFRNFTKEKKRCHDREKNFCIFNKGKSKKIILLGDSHVDTLLGSFVLNEKYNDYEITNLSYSGNIYLPGFNKVVKKSKKIMDINHTKNRFEFINEDQNQIIIIAYRFPLYLTGKHFDNLEGGIEKKEFNDIFVSLAGDKTLEHGIRNSILELAKNNKIILLYPIPEAGWDIPEKILKIFSRKFVKKEDSDQIEKFLKKNKITTSYNVFKNRSKSSFELLDSINHKNILKVYPHELFCDKEIKDRCVTHDSKDIFYVDSHHPSFTGSKMINKLIYEKIKKIEDQD